MFDTYEGWKAQLLSRGWSQPEPDAGPHSLKAAATLKGAVDRDRMQHHRGISDESHESLQAVHRTKDRPKSSFKRDLVRHLIRTLKCSQRIERHTALSRQRSNQTEKRVAEPLVACRSQQQVLYVLINKRSPL